MGTEELIQVIKDDANGRWYTKGWDVVVETLTDEQIAVLIGGATTPNGARRRVHRWVSMDSRFLMSLPENFYELY